MQACDIKVDASEKAEPSLRCLQTPYQYTATMHRMYLHSIVSTVIKQTRSTVERNHHSPQAPSFHPIGTNAAATCCSPLSVANKLNCAAAFLVS